MRRRIGTWLLAVLMLAALAVPAFAAGLQEPAVVDAKTCTAALSGTDKIEVTVKDAVSGAQYLVFMLNGEGKPAEANIQYIDQNGTGAFVVFPKEGMTSGTYYIYVASNTDGRFDGTKYVASVEYQADAPSYKLGDVDKNGKVLPKDALMTLQKCAGKIEFDEIQMLAADVDHNGKVLPKDALMILQSCAGKITLE